MPVTYLSAHEVARLLGISLAGVRKARQRGTLQSVNIAGRYLFTPTSIAAYKESKRNKK